MKRDHSQPRGSTTLCDKPAYYEQLESRRQTLGALSILTVAELRYFHVQGHLEREISTVKAEKMFRVLATQFRSNALRLALRKTGAVMLTAVYVGGCGAVQQHFVCVRADRTICRQSAYPLAMYNAKVGKYAAKTKSGAGYFYDDVLEYRVWFCPERGAKPLNGRDDYYVAFAEYERAQELSKASKGAEEPLVLVRQYEWINEPKPGHYQAEKGNRITEWQVEWLEGSKRTPDSTRDFLKLLKETVSKDTVLTRKNNAPCGATPDLTGRLKSFSLSQTIESQSQTCALSFLPV